MPSELVIRPGKAEEAPLLNGIEQRAASLLRGHPAHALFSRHVLPLPMLVAAAHADRLLVAGHADGVAGYVLYGELSGDAHLLQMDVDPAHGRRGIGRALLQAICERAAVAGFPAMVLTTLTDVPWNAPFYASAGFEMLPASRWSPALRELMDEEQRLGFPMHLRVAMRKSLA